MINSVVTPFTEFIRINLALLSLGSTIQPDEIENKACADEQE